VLGFVLRFGLFWAAALGILSLVPGLERWTVDGTVANLALVLRALAVKTVVSDNFIQAGNATIEIVPDCTSLMPTMVFWAAVAAFPTAWRRRAVGLLMGAVVVWAFNLVRVMALIAVLWWMPRHFKFVHVYIWQAGTLLVVTAMFMYWVRLEARTLAER
jgi:exosortase/archaeosortase family protein